MYDLPWWVMGLMCLMVLGLLLLLIVLIVVRRGGSRRPLSDIEKDYDERQRGRER
ncbi:MAG TPA: hypothetical protein VFB89_03535 [Gemmatimonadales bacterium]|nr:hypothetical protein [Gemmatimonadales bacterium]